jgi:hypothetical protein
VCGFIAAKPGK